MEQYLPFVYYSAHIYSKAQIDCASIVFSNNISRVMTYASIIGTNGGNNAGNLIFCKEYCSKNTYLDKSL